LYELLLGCVTVDQQLDRGSGREKKIFLAMLKQKNGQNPGKSSSDGRARYRNRLGVVELVGRGPLMFARVENGVTRFSPKKKKTPQNKNWTRNRSFQWKKIIFLVAEKLTWGV